jgi:hypothetical protein
MAGGGNNLGNMSGNWPGLGGGWASANNPNAYGWARDPRFGGRQDGAGNKGAAPGVPGVGSPEWVAAKQNVRPGGLGSPGWAGTTRPLIDPAEMPPGFGRGPMPPGFGPMPPEFGRGFGSMPPEFGRELPMARMRPEPPARPDASWRPAGNNKG